MSLVRLGISAISLATAVGVAYLAMWQGLGGNSSLSDANTDFAIKTGLAYGCCLVAMVNCLPIWNRERTLKIAGIVILALHLLFGLSLMIWTAAIASV